MTDRDKLKLIDKMIADFWEYGGSECGEKANAVLEMITTVIDFEDKEDEK